MTTIPLRDWSLFSSLIFFFIKPVMKICTMLYFLFFQNTYVYVALSLTSKSYRVTECLKFKRRFFDFHIIKVKHLSMNRLFCFEAFVKCFRLLCFAQVYISLQPIYRDLCLLQSLSKLHKCRQNY